MSTLAARLSKLAIKVASPDGTVRANLTVKAIGVQLAPGASERHTDATLTRQAEAALTTAFRGYTRATNMLRAEAAGREVPGPEDLPPDHPRRRLHEAERDLVTEAFSANDWFSLTWRGADTFKIEARPGTVRRLSAEELGKELESLVLEAGRVRRGQVQEIQKEALREMTG